MGLVANARRASFNLGTYSHITKMTYICDILFIIYNKTVFFISQTLDLQRGCLRTGNARAKIVNLREL